MDYIVDINIWHDGLTIIETPSLFLYFSTASETKSSIELKDSVKLFDFFL